MLRFRRTSAIPFTASQFRIGQTTATAFNTDSAGMSVAVSFLHVLLIPAYCDLTGIAHPSPNGSGHDQENTSSVATTVGLMWFR